MGSELAHLGVDRGVWEGIKRGEKNMTGIRQELRVT